MKNPNARPRRVSRLAVVLAAAVGLLAVGSAPALAAGTLPTVTGDAGWMRVAHLSPDTKEVDVQLTALSGGAALFELDNVGYGVVSDYIQVPVGTYVVSMVPAGTDSTAKPMIAASVKIDKDKTITVAAFGQNSALQTRVFQDDLATPAAGSSKIRLIQASTVTSTVNVETTTGLLIARDAKSGDSSSYATVPAGPWDLALTATGISDQAQVSLPDGSVNTLFVLDNSTGGLTVMSVLDSASVGAAPIGGVQTGGGALGEAFPQLVTVGSN